MTVTEAAAISFPDSSAVEHAWRGKGLDRPRYYRHKLEDWTFVGVSTPLKAWDKAGLIHWAAREERKVCIDSAVTVHLRGKDLGPAAFIQAMEAQLGPAKAHQRQKDKAAAIGTAVHKYVEWTLKGELGLPRGEAPAMSDAALLGFMAWEDEWKKAGITPVRMEQPVWSRSNQVAGTVDLFGLRNGELGIVDLKTSTGIYGVNHLQVAAYAEVAQELLQTPVTWAELWRIPKTLEDIRLEVVPVGQYKVWDGKQQIKRVADRQRLFAAYLGIKNAWELLCEPDPD